MNFELHLEESEYLRVPESVEDAIVRMAVDRVEQLTRERALKKIDESIEDIISEQVKKNIEGKVDALLDNFMNKPITVSDGYREKEYGSLLDLVEEKLSSTYTQRLGKTCGEDKLLEKIKNNVSATMRRYTDQVEKLLATEGRKIAREELAKSEIAKAINLANLKD